jgi:RHS repeat-associated protein
MLTTDQRCLYENESGGPNNRNQLSESYEMRTELTGSTWKNVRVRTTYAYDRNGNRVRKVIDKLDGAVASLNGEAYRWDTENRLTGVWRGPWASTYQYVPWEELPRTVYSRDWRYGYDYRSRRVWRDEQELIPGGQHLRTLVVFSGGTAIAEYGEPAAVAADAAWNPRTTPDVLYIRGSDMGGGTGGLLYSLRPPPGTTGILPGSSGPPAPNYYAAFNRYNSRGDVVSQSDAAGAVTWAASYRADGKRTSETGTNRDRQRANTKEEDPTGLLNEGFRYRDTETGTFISRDPLGFVDGPNVYAYVQQNPWTKFDPNGLLNLDPNDGFIISMAKYTAGFLGGFWDGTAGAIKRNAEQAVVEAYHVNQTSGPLAALGSAAARMTGAMNVLESVEGKAIDLHDNGDLGSHEMGTLERVLSAAFGSLGVTTTVTGGGAMFKFGPKGATAATEGSMVSVRPPGGMRTPVPETQLTKTVEKNAMETLNAAFPDAPPAGFASGDTMTFNTGNCFGAGTTVIRPDGECVIEEVQLGDRVSTEAP